MIARRYHVPLVRGASHTGRPADSFGPDDVNDQTTPHQLTRGDSRAPMPFDTFAAALSMQHTHTMQEVN